LVFELRVFARQSVTSWPNDVFVRRGERRRRGTGSAIEVGVWEGMIGRILYFRDRDASKSLKVVSRTRRDLGKYLLILMTNVRSEYAGDTKLMLGSVGWFKIRDTDSS
jgi:hypothetical protein